MTAGWSAAVSRAARITLVSTAVPVVAYLVEVLAGDEPFHPTVLAGDAGHRVAAADDRVG